MARGLRNNNPGNIRKSNETFQGETASSDKSFKQFISMAYGYRAIFVVLGTYLGRRLNTIEKIIKTWAPPNENNTQAYIDTVCKMSGIDRNKVLTAADGVAYIKIVEAISFVENGVKASLPDIESGFKLQNKITK